MPDREKVKYDIERCICHVPDACRDCSHYQDDPELDCMEKLLADALALLKEQETVEPIIMGHIVFGTSRKCSKCNRYLFPAGRYCPHCGRYVRWEDD